ncbi:MAG TPA: AraC family transcriptional regulator, partial [Clostridium sp.]
DSTFNTAEITNYLLRALIVIILSIIEKSSQSLESNGKIIAMRIKKHIDVHCLEDINLYTVSTELNISQYYLCHIFKENFGYSPIQYVIRRRIGEAQSFLINTDYSVTKIATMVGFNNSNHFHTIFLKMIGMPPLQYRKYWVEEHRNRTNGK